jgi:hypothetical protein
MGPKPPYTIKYVKPHIGGNRLSMIIFENPRVNKASPP